MFIEHQLLKRSVDSEWELVLYVGKYENSEESVTLDKDYNVIEPDQIYDVRPTSRGVHLRIPETGGNMF